MKTAIQYQLNDSSFSLIELDLPCYYLLKNDLAKIMTVSKIKERNMCFERNVISQ